jgi:DNA-directed RNA polymerase subunit M/transcription elongation factor TFIIS
MSSRLLIYDDEIEEDDSATDEEQSEEQSEEEDEDDDDQPIDEELDEELDDIDEEEVIEEVIEEEINEPIDDGLMEDEGGMEDVYNEESDLKTIKKRTLRIQFYKVGSTYNDYNYGTMSEIEQRDKVKQLFFTILQNEKNAETFEKYCWNHALTNLNNVSKTYVELVRSVVDYLYEISVSKEGNKFNMKKLSEVLHLIKMNQLNYEASFYDTYRNDVLKEIKKLQTPVEVLEGIFTCPKCHSTKTYHYGIQTRSGDEAMTVFIHCQNKHCKYAWRKNG